MAVGVILGSGERAAPQGGGAAARRLREPLGFSVELALGLEPEELWSVLASPFTPGL
jgi:hypothetical protein